MTGMTTWEKWAAGLPPQGRDEIARYREYDAAGGTTTIGYPEPDGGPLQVLSSPQAREERVMSTLKPASDLTRKERTAACVFTVEGDGYVRYVNGVTGDDIDPETLVPVPAGAAS